MDVQKHYERQSLRGRILCWSFLTLCVGMPPLTLRVIPWDAERPEMHSHAEYWNDQI